MLGSPDGIKCPVTYAQVRIPQEGMDHLSHSASRLSRFSHSVPRIVLWEMGLIVCRQDSRDACACRETAPVGWRSRSWHYSCWHGVLFISLRRVASTETDCLVCGDARTLAGRTVILLRCLLTIGGAQEKLCGDSRKRLTLNFLEFFAVLCTGRERYAPTLGEPVAHFILDNLEHKAEV